MKKSKGDDELKRNLVVLFLFCFFLLIPGLNVSAEEPVLDIEEYAAEMQPGWNLGNTFDALGEDETGWGNPYVTEELIQSIANQGYKSIRIPITFDERMGSEPDYQIDANFLGRVTKAVDWSLDAGMKVMINVHHDSWVWLEWGMDNDYDQSVARFEAIWEQLAEHFLDYGSDLMFESINEPRFAPYDDGEAQALNYLDDLNNRFYEIVRNSGGNNETRPIVIPTLHTGSDQIYLDRLSAWLEEKNDPYTIATIHYYGFWPFSVNIAGHTTFDQSTIDELHDTFDRVHNQFSQNGIPVVIGEFGLLGFDQNVYTIQQGEKLKYFEYMIHYAQEKDLVHMLWDNGQHFDRHNYQWQDQELYEMMFASFSGRSATAESDFIYFKQDEAISDQELTLNLNGRTLENIYHNNVALVKNADYSVDGTTLIISADLLTELVDLDQFGKSNELILEFDQGANWRVDLIVYNTAEVYENEDHYTTFQIPTSFNGDQLATLEAYYEDGSGAGPQDWTTFKEFAYVFSPDYDSGAIDFTYNEWDDHSRLFDEIRQDEAVSIRLHFWSGTTLDYELIRSGDQVIGYPVQAKEIDPDDEDDEDEVVTPPVENEEDEEEEQDEEAVVEGEDPTLPVTEDDENNQAPTLDNNDNLKSEDQNRTQLPQTATNISNFLVIGIVLLSVGVIGFIYTKRKKLI